MHRGFGLKDATRLSNILDMDSLLNANVKKLKKKKNQTSTLVKYSNGNGISLSEGNRET